MVETVHRFWVAFLNIWKCDLLQQADEACRRWCALIISPPIVCDADAQVCRCRRAGGGRRGARPMFDLLQSTVLSTRALLLLSFFLGGKKRGAHDGGRAIQRDAYLRHVYVKMRSWSAALGRLLPCKAGPLPLGWGSVTSAHLAKYARFLQPAHTYLNTFVTASYPHRHACTDTPSSFGVARLSTAFTQRKRGPAAEAADINNH